MRYYYLQRRTTADDTGLGSVPGRPSRVLLVTREVGLLCPYRYLPFPRVIDWRRQRPPTPVLLPGKSHRRRSLVGCSPWGRKKLDMTELLHFHFSLSCFGEGNGNPLQCSCLENPRDVGAWWAAVYGVAQSWTRLKRLSSSSSRVIDYTR